MSTDACQEILKGGKRSQMDGTGGLTAITLVTFQIRISSDAVRVRKEINIVRYSGHKSKTADWKQSWTLVALR